MAKVDSDAEMNDMLWRVKKGELSSESEDDSALDQSFDSDAPVKKRDAKKKSKKYKKAKKDKKSKKDKKAKKEKKSRKRDTSSDQESSDEKPVEKPVVKRQKVTDYPSIDLTPSRNQWTGLPFSPKYHEILKKRK